MHTAHCGNFDGEEARARAIAKRGTTKTNEKCMTMTMFAYMHDVEVTCTEWSPVHSICTRSAVAPWNVAQSIRWGCSQLPAVLTLMGDMTLLGNNNNSYKQQPKRHYTLTLGRKEY